MVDYHRAPTSDAVDGKLRVSLPRSSTAPLSIVHGVVTVEGSPDSYRVLLKENVVPVPQNEGLASILLAALIGGFILNFMPCVFPVISLKVLSFVQGGRAALHGALFTLGIVVSFWTLAGVLMLLTASGEQLGWGFQFQSPRFVAFMGYFVFAIGLNLAGVFEIGTKVQTVAGRLDKGQGLIGVFGSGALATLLATPCSAPFMATAVASALTMPPLQSALVFSFLGLGMGLPYLLLPLFPAALKYLPKPGKWMVIFRQIMAFPMFGTAAWLGWVLMQQLGPIGMTAFILGLLPLSLGLWAHGHWGNSYNSAARRLSLGFTAALVACAGIPIMNSSLAKSEMKPTEGIQWQPYSKSLLESIVSRGEPVLVDFTAAWCLTCQLNHRMAFESVAVAQKLSRKGVHTLRADWTSPDPEITAQIHAFGRSGVPLVVLYVPGKEPQTLPQILTEPLVLEAVKEIPEGPALAAKNLDSKV